MPMQFGSGSQLLGGTSALNEAMARRGIDASVLNQVGGGAPNAQPMSGPMPVGTPVPGAGQAAAQVMPPQVGMPPPPMPTPVPTPTSESELILKALSARLSSDSKIKEASAIPKF